MQFPQKRWQVLVSLPPHLVVTELSRCTGVMRKESQEPRDFCYHSSINHRHHQCFGQSQGSRRFRPYLLDQISPSGWDNSGVYLPASEVGKNQRTCQPDLWSRQQKRCQGLQVAGCWRKAAWLMAEWTEMTLQTSRIRSAANGLRDMTGRCKRI